MFYLVIYGRNSLLKLWNTGVQVMACRTCFREVSVDAGQKRPSREGEFPSVVKDAATEAGKPEWGSTRQMRVAGVCVFEVPLQQESPMSCGS